MFETDTRSHLFLFRLGHNEQVHEVLLEYSPFIIVQVLTLVVIQKVSILNKNPPTVKMIIVINHFWRIITK
jgi:hypothetical protein